MSFFTPDVLARLRQADKIPYAPQPREFLRRAPTRAVMLVVDAITRAALARARTPTFDARIARGVSATDARTVFPTITGPAHTSILTGARVGAFPHGRLALVPRKLTEAEYSGLLQDSRVEDICDRQELELLGAWGPRWGEHVIQLNEGMMFPHQRNLVGYHGARSQIEKHVPLVLSGAGIRAGARLTTCETIDVAPTLSLLLGAPMPDRSEGRVLWEALDAESAPEPGDAVHLILERDELLHELKALKKEYARQSIHREEFMTRRAELARLAERNIAASRPPGGRPPKA